MVARDAIRPKPLPPTSSPHCYHRNICQPQVMPSIVGFIPRCDAIGRQRSVGRGVAPPREPMPTTAAKPQREAKQHHLPWIEPIRPERKKDPFDSTEWLFEL